MMSDYEEKEECNYGIECGNCGRFLDPDEDFTEERDDYGFPIAICDQCENKTSDTTTFGI